MVRCLTILAVFVFVLVPAVSFAQSDNNCISYHCYFPPVDCAYCDSSYTNGSSSCTAFADGTGCYVGGFCNTGLGGCINADDCTLIQYRDFWIRLERPRALRDEWQLVDVSVKAKVAHRVKRA